MLIINENYNNNNNIILMKVTIITIAYATLAKVIEERSPQIYNIQHTCRHIRVSFLPRLDIPIHT